MSQLDPANRQQKSLKSIKEKFPDIEFSGPFWCDCKDGRPLQLTLRFSDGRKHYVTFDEDDFDDECEKHKITRMIGIILGRTV